MRPPAQAGGAEPAAPAECRLLGPGDEAALDTFLARAADTSMFLRSNAHAAGLVDRGAPMQGTYVGAFEAGRLAAVVAHCWNGVLLVQAATHAGRLAREAVHRSGRAICGLSGPWEQVAAVRVALGLDRIRASKVSREDLYALNLVDLIVPQALESGALRCRHPMPSEVDLLVAWRVTFCVEALGTEDGPDLRHSARAEIDLLRERDADWVLVDGATPVSYSSFNAMLSDIVQVGGVWTPPELRGRGYGRAVVAGSLLAARRAGVRRAVLFTDPRNPAARTAYRALGFRIVGDYGLVLLPPTRPRDDDSFSAQST
jgi:ribosomal protein S18 acetylase RimI-like enzyme